MNSTAESETEEVIERIFTYLWKCDSCVFYLRNYLASPAIFELENYEARNWSLLKINGTVGFFENDKKLYCDMCDFLTDRLYDIWPAENLKDRSLIAKLNLIYWILLPEALRYGLQQELGVTQSEAKNIVIYGYEYHLPSEQINGTTPLANTLTPKNNEEQSQISNSVTLSNWDANVTPSSSLSSGGNVVEAVKNYPAMKDCNTSSLHLLKNAEPNYIDGGDNVDALMQLQVVKSHVFDHLFSNLERNVNLQQSGFVSYRNRPSRHSRDFSSQKNFINTLMTENISQILMLYAAKTTRILNLRQQALENDC